MAAAQYPMQVVEDLSGGTGGENGTGYDASFVRRVVHAGDVHPTGDTQVTAVVTLQEYAVNNPNFNHVRLCVDGLVAESLTHVGLLAEAGFYHMLKRA